MDPGNKFGFKDLRVWQKAVDFADLVISTSENFCSPKLHLRLVEQLEAASSSISLNIAEGKGRYSKKEFIHYLYIARGSTYETVTLVEIFHRRNWITQKQKEKIQNKAYEIAAMIKSLINSLD